MSWWFKAILWFATNVWLILSAWQCALMHPILIKAGFHSGKYGSDQTGLFSILYYPHRRTKKSWKYFNFLSSRFPGRRFKLEQKIGTQSSYTGSILFRSGPILFLSGNRPLLCPSAGFNARQLCSWTGECCHSLGLTWKWNEFSLFPLYVV